MNRVARQLSGLAASHLRLQAAEYAGSGAATAVGQRSWRSSCTGEAPASEFVPFLSRATAAQRDLGCAQGATAIACVSSHRRSPQGCASSIDHLDMSRSWERAHAASRTFRTAPGLAAPPAAASDTAEVDASAEEPASPVPKKWDHWLDVTGRVDGQYEVAKQQCFAIVEIGSHQYKVTADDVVYSLYIPGLDVNDKVNLKRVLLLGNPTETRIGRPVVADAHCEAVVEEVFKDAKKHIFRFRKKSHRKYKTVRPLFTKLRITKVHGIDG